MSTTTTSWYESGYSGADREQEKRDLGTGPKRWWMGAGTTKQGVLIDDSPVCCQEHQWKVADSKFPLWATCLNGTAPDVVCTACGARGVEKPAYTGHLTIVDVTGYTTKDGKEVKFELVEFCPKLKAMNKLKLKKAAKGSLVGQLWNITRADKDTPSTGDDFDHVREAKMDELYKVVTYRGKNVSELITKANGHGDEAAKMRRFLAYNFQIPSEGEIPARIPAFNYMKLHEPMSAADLRRAVAGAVGFNSGGFGGGSGGGSPGGGPGTADDTVPF